MLRTLIAFFLLFASIAHGADTLKLDIYSVENNTCADWKKISNDPAAIKVQYFWFLGFVSGNNFALPASQVSAKRMISESGFVSLVNSRCKASSNYTVTVIAMEFIELNSPPANEKTKAK